MTTPGTTPPIGLIGLGLMGTAFVSRLRQGPQPLVGFDLARDRREALAQLGGEPVESAAEVFRRADQLLFSLPSHHEVGEVVAANAPHLRSGQIIVDTTTGDPRHAAELAADLETRGVIYLDATISGNSAQVREGTAVIMVGGNPAAYAACAGLLGRLGGESFHTGPSGTGAKMKLVTNLVLGLNRAALAEGLALGEALGLEPELTFRVMRRSPAYSRAMDAKGEKMIHSDFTPDARLSQHLKDVRLMLELGAAAGLPMILSDAHRSILEQAEAAGLGSLDNSALIQVLRGLTLPGGSR